MDQVFLDNGDAINPEGAAWIDPGLGGFLENSSDPIWVANRSLLKRLVILCMVN